MPAPDGNCGIRTHDPWIHEAWPLLTEPSMQTAAVPVDPLDQQYPGTRGMETFPVTSLMTTDGT